MSESDKRKKLREAYESLFGKPGSRQPPGRIPKGWPNPYDDGDAGQWVWKAIGKPPEFADESQLVLETKTFLYNIYWQQHARLYVPLTLDVMLETEGGDGRIEIEYGGDANDEDRPKVLLLLAGYSVEQLALSIAAHAENGCQRVIPFTSGECWDAVYEDVAKYLGKMEDEKDRILDYHLPPCSKAETVVASKVCGKQILLPKWPVEVDPGNPADVFRKLVTWLRNHRGQVRAAIDCTGGQKPMDSGATQAASFWGIPAYYIHFDKYDDKLRRPLPHTSRYVQLELPETAFSLSARRAIIERFESRDFQAAYLLAVQMATGVYDATRGGSGNSEPFGQLEDLIAVGKSVRKSRDWAHVRYHRRSLKAHNLHKYFRDFVKANKEHSKSAAQKSGGNKTEQKKSKPLDQVVLGLREKSRRTALLEYVVDEYWRLSTMLEVEQVRDVIVGSVGLVELVVDSLFSFPWAKTIKIKTDSDVTPLALFRKNGKKIKPVPASDIPSADTLQWSKAERFPMNLMPFAAQGDKVQLMRFGSAKFRMFLPVDGTGRPHLKLDCSPPKESQPRFEALVTLRTSHAPLKQIENNFWQSFWGKYPGEWALCRHKVAHVRAPVLDPAVNDWLNNEVMPHYLPRFVELLFRMVDAESDGKEVDLSDSHDTGCFLKWKCSSKTYHGKCWDYDARVPWAPANEKKLAELLCIPSTTE